jgi:hypothetical protein
MERFFYSVRRSHRGVLFEPSRAHKSPAKAFYLSTAPLVERFFLFGSAAPSRGAIRALSRPQIACKGVLPFNRSANGAVFLFGSAAPSRDTIRALSRPQIACKGVLPFNRSADGAVFYSVRRPHRGVLFEPSRAHKSPARAFYRTDLLIKRLSHKQGQINGNSLIVIDVDHLNGGTDQTLIARIVADRGCQHNGVCLITVIL